MRQEAYDVHIYQGPKAEGLPLPSYAHEGDVCLDLPTAVETVIPPHSGGDVETDLRFVIPPGKYLHIYGKGSGAKAGASIDLVIVDQGYTGPLTLFVWNMSDKPMHIPRGKCIAQGLFRSYDKVNLVPITLEQMDSVHTERGAGRMNSSGRGLE